MKNLKIFITIFSVLIYTNIFPDGYIQVHNKTKYPATITYNFGTKDRSITVNKYENSRILSTNRGIFESSSGNINKLETKLNSNSKNKVFDSVMMDNLDISVKTDEITHIYIIYVKNSNKKPKLRIACMQKGKIIKSPLLEKDSTNIKTSCNSQFKTKMKPRISYIHKKLANERAIFIIKNQSKLTLEVKTRSIAFYEDYANIKSTYLYPGDYYYQTLDEVFEAKNLKIKEVDGQHKKTISEIKIPTGMVTTLNITEDAKNLLETKIERKQRISDRY